MFRNPRYLNVPLLRSLADYQGIELPGDREVTRRARGESGSRVGLRGGVDIGREGSTEDEVTETFSEPFRPVRGLNDVVDDLLRDEAVVDLTLDLGQPVARRSAVQVEGMLELSPVTEVAAILSAFVPSLIAQASSGSGDFEPDPSILSDIVLGRSAPDVTHVFELEVGEHRFTILVDPEHLLGATMEDLEDDLTVFAIVDRLVSEGESRSLDRYVLPELNRTVRRTLAGSELEDVMRSFGEAFNRRIDASSLVVSGPAAILTPIAIY